MFVLAHLLFGWVHIALPWNSIVFHLTAPTTTNVSKSRGKAAKKEQICVSYTPELLAGIRQLSETTRVPMAVYFEEALEDLLKKYAAALRKAKKRLKSIV